MSATEKLAIHGGVPVITPDLVPEMQRRWGEPELESLRQAVEQPTLFYFNNKSTGRMLEKFRSMYPLEHVMPCSSGTASIHIALCAAGIAPGDEVITTPITDMGTVVGILLQQAVPVFADLGAHTYNLDPKDVEAKITSRTKAILAVHLCGNPCDMDALQKLATKHRLVLIEDCAQAWGARFRGRPVGTVGDIGCYSLNDFKHISCGDGGIVGSNNPKFGNLLQPFGDKGYDRVNQVRSSELLATCYRMSELQSAFAVRRPRPSLRPPSGSKSTNGWKKRTPFGLPGLSAKSRRITTADLPGRKHPERPGQWQQIPGLIGPRAQTTFVRPVPTCGARSPGLRCACSPVCWGD